MWCIIIKKPRFLALEILVEQRWYHTITQNNKAKVFRVLLQDLKVDPQLPHRSS